MITEFMRPKGTHVKTEAEIGSWKVQGGCSQSLRRDQDPADARIPDSETTHFRCLRPQFVVVWQPQETDTGA